MSTDQPPTDTNAYTTGTFARISGTVQGVNFRAATKAEADELGLVGWVRNTRDGDVELLVGGSNPAVNALLNWCRTGPQSAKVETVDQREAIGEELESLPTGRFDVMS